MTASSHTPSSVADTPSSVLAAGEIWLWAALVVALSGLAGSLYLSLGMGLKACALCFYQRTFMMALVAVLGVGLLGGSVQPGRLSLLALPLAAAGLGVALFHVYLEAVGKLECPKGAMGLGSAPQQSLVAFVLLFALLVAGVLGSGPLGTHTRTVLAGGLILGGLLAVASSISNPPMQRPKPEVYAKPPDVCRPPKQSD